MNFLCTRRLWRTWREMQTLSDPGIEPWTRVITALPPCRGKWGWEQRDKSLLQRLGQSDKDRSVNTWRDRKWGTEEEDVWGGERRAAHSDGGWFSSKVTVWPSAIKRVLVNLQLKDKRQVPSFQWASVNTSHRRSSHTVASAVLARASFDHVQQRFQSYYFHPQRKGAIS